MIDMSTYTDLHGDVARPARENQSETEKGSVEEGTRYLGEDEMERSTPPSGPFVLMLPPTIIGFRFHDKKWSKCSISRLVQR